MKQKILFVVCLLFGLLFINSGLNKFFNYMPMPSDMPEAMLKLFASFMEIKFLMPLVAVAEIIGGLLFIFSKTRALGAIIIFPVNIGILLTHILFVPSGIVLAIILLGINLWVLVINKDKYMPMIEN